MTVTQTWNIMLKTKNFFKDQMFIFKLTLNVLLVKFWWMISHHYSESYQSTTLKLYFACEGIVQENINYKFCHQLKLQQKRSDTS